jgi:hypothetical protein
MLHARSNQERGVSDNSLSCKSGRNGSKIGPRSQLRMRTAGRRYSGNGRDADRRDDHESPTTESIDGPISAFKAQQFAPSGALHFRNTSLQTAVWVIAPP